MNAKKLKQEMVSYFQGLNNSVLNDIYTFGACIWVDTGDYEIYKTSGIDEWNARREMAQRMSNGDWVPVSILLDTHEEHPWNDEWKAPIREWTPGAAWIRAELLYFIEEFVDELMRNAESLEESRSSGAYE